MLHLVLCHRVDTIRCDLESIVYNPPSSHISPQVQQTSRQKAEELLSLIHPHYQALGVAVLNNDAQQALQKAEALIHLYLEKYAGIHH